MEYKNISDRDVLVVMFLLQKYFIGFTIGSVVHYYRVYTVAAVRRQSCIQNHFNTVSFYPFSKRDQHLEVPHTVMSAHLPHLLPQAQYNACPISISHPINLSETFYI